MDKKVTTIYKVYGCDDGGNPILDAEFIDMMDACSYAVANKGRIHYGLPAVDMHIYAYDQVNKKVSCTRARLSPENVYAVAKATEK